MKLEYMGKAHYPPADFPRFEVDPELCNRCGRCVRTCPTHILAMPEDGPPHIRGYKGLEVACLGCRNCEAVCPEDAVEVKGGYVVREGRYKSLHHGKVELPNPFGQDEAPPLEEVEDRLTETEKVIYKRRSNRLFKNREVPDELLHRVMEAGRYSPTGGNCQSWEFVCIRDQELIRRIETSSLKSLRRMSENYLKPGSRAARWLWNLLSFWRPGDMDVRVMSGMDTAVLRDTLYFGAPAVIVVLSDKRGIGQPALDAGICAQNMVLAAHSLGLGTCYVGFITALNTMPDKELVKELGVEWPLRIATSIAVGWPKGRIDKAVPRQRPRITWK
ncbi:MAG: nitroreductase family protein [bacterium]